MSRFIDLQRQARGRVEVVLDRPDKLNALSLSLLGELIDILNRLRDDDDIRCVVLSGAGRAFSAGADLADLRRLERSSAERFIRCLHDACQAVRDCPVPVIARIDGPCLGGALELAASCDMRAASGRSTFAMPEVRLGIPSVIEAALLPPADGLGSGCGTAVHRPHADRQRSPRRRSGGGRGRGTGRCRGDMVRRHS